MRKRGHVNDVGDFETGSSEGAHCGFSTGSRTVDRHADLLEAVLLSDSRCFISSDLRSERGALSAALEVHVASACPADRVAVWIGDRNDRIVE